MKTLRLYDGRSRTSVKSAVCHALSHFLLNEEHDYHTYKGLCPN